MFCQRHHKVVFFAQCGLGIPTEKVRTKRIYPFSRCGIALSCSIRLLTKKTLSLSTKATQKTTTTFRRLLFSLSLKKTHRPVARVNQPRRFVRVDFRLLFPMASGIDDISRSRRGSMVAHLHDDDDGLGVRVFVLFLSFFLSLSLRVLNERSFDIESER